GIVTEPTWIGWRCAAEPGCAATADRATVTVRAVAPGDTELAKAWPAPRPTTAAAPATALTINPARGDTCDMRTRSHPGRPRARSRAVPPPTCRRTVTARLATRHHP